LSKFEKKVYEKLDCSNDGMDGEKRRKNL